MPLYDFICPLCGGRREVFYKMMQRKPRPRCDCGHIMDRDFSGSNLHANAKGQWSDENGGRGRKIMGLMQHGQDDGPHCYHKSPAELMSFVKRAADRGRVKYQDCRDRACVSPTHIIRAK